MKFTSGMSYSATYVTFKIELYPNQRQTTLCISKYTIR